ncbi:hypothetical protein JXA85_07410, partial [Candidatus Woesearchaeota archaeon]|nr:hypothetical protein [Candidatus Woesearchaeota archaeon]
SIELLQDGTEAKIVFAITERIKGNPRFLEITAIEGKTLCVVTGITETKNFHNNWFQCIDKYGILKKNIALSEEQIKANGCRRPSEIMPEFREPSGITINEADKFTIGKDGYSINRGLYFYAKKTTNHEFICFMPRSGNGFLRGDNCDVTYNTLKDGCFEDVAISLIPKCTT